MEEVLFQVSPGHPSSSGSTLPERQGYLEEDLFLLEVEKEDKKRVLLGRYGLRKISLLLEDRFFHEKVLFHLKKGSWKRSIKGERKEFSR